MRLFCQTKRKPRPPGLTCLSDIAFSSAETTGGRAGDVGSGLVLGLSPENCRGSDLRTKAEFDGYLGGSFCYATSSLENYRLY